MLGFNVAQHQPNPHTSVLVAVSILEFKDTIRSFLLEMLQNDHLITTETFYLNIFDNSARKHRKNPLKDFLNVENQETNLARQVVKSK